VLGVQLVFVSTTIAVLVRCVFVLKQAADDTRRELRADLNAFMDEVLRRIDEIETGRGTA
jgi:hypothetical protein